MEEIKAIINETRDDMDRVAGSTRIETLVEVSKRHYEEADSVVICNAWSPSDLSAGTIEAVLTNRPLLGVKYDELSEATKDEYKRLKAYDFTIIGGISAVSSKVEMELRAL
jgi:putative cell wall-binding protein